MRVTCADRRAYFFSIGGAVFSAGAGAEGEARIATERALEPAAK